MAGSLLTYSGIVTKTRAMQSHLITMDDYHKIANFDTTADFINYLKTKNGYDDIFQTVDEQNLHRGKIEEYLTNSVYLSFAKLYRFANQKQRAVLNFKFLRYEVNILKICLRNVFSENADSYDLSMFEPFFHEHSDLKVAELASAKSMDEFINLLKDTKYYSLFEKLRNSNHETLHDFEVQLDLYYYTRVWKAKDQLLKGINRRSFTAAFGSELDLLNIIWIYRSKKFYDIESAKVLASIIPIGYKLKRDELKKLIESVSVEDFIRILKTTYYANICGDLDNISMEVSYKKIMSKIHATNATKYSSSMAPVLNYLFLKDQELDRLTTALECIRYKLEPERTIKYILEQ